jgi:hypothetical protein
MSEIISGIEAFLAQQGIDDINAWIGTLKQ